MGSKSKISIIGTRGIPNKHGGFEQFAQIASDGLSEFFNVTVYNSSQHPYKEKKFNNVKIVHKWCDEKFFGPLAHFIYDYLCLKDSIKNRNEIIIALGYGTLALSLMFVNLKKSQIIVNMDGIEWKRNDISFFKKYLLILFEKITVKKANFLISDGIPIKDYYKNKFNKDSFYLPYGTEIFKNPNQNYLKNYELIPKDYLLMIARFEPSNNIKKVIEGYMLSSQKNKLIIVGNYDNKYGKSLKKKYKSKNIIFLGGVYDNNTLNNLRYFSKLYLHGHSVGGTPPSLIEAMGCNCLIAAHDNIFNRHILEENSFYFKSIDDIKNIIDNININNNKHSMYTDNNIKKIKKTYLWNSIIESLVNYLEKIKENKL